MPTLRRSHRVRCASACGPLRLRRETLGVHLTAPSDANRILAMRRSLIVVGAVLAVAVVAGAATVWLSRPREVKVDHTDRALVARGEPLYQLHCAPCHGAQLEGEPNWTTRDVRGRLPAPPHDESGHTWHTTIRSCSRSRSTASASTRHGAISRICGLRENMSDEDIVATLAYIKSRWPAAVHEKRAAAGMN